jgi:hypothetical protein
MVLNSDAKLEYQSSTGKTCSQEGRLAPALSTRPELSLNSGLVLYPARAFAALADILERELPLAAAPTTLGWGIVHAYETIATAAYAQILERGFPFSFAAPALNLSSSHRLSFA